MNSSFVYCLSADDVVPLTESVQCSEQSEDLSKSNLSLTTPVFYACGSRVFKTRAIYDVTCGNSNLVCYNAEQLSSAENADVDVNHRLMVSDRICPYCNRLIAGSASRAEYERHIQSHLDSDDDDDDDNDVI